MLAKMFDPLDVTASNKEPSSLVIRKLFLALSQSREPTLSPIRHQFPPHILRLPPAERRDWLARQLPTDTNTTGSTGLALVVNNDG